jgi:hypothetical protein
MVRAGWKLALPLGSNFSYPFIMTDAIAGNRKRGRPATGRTLVGVKFLPEELAALDAWIAAQPEPRPARPEAIRKVLKGAL